MSMCQFWFNFNNAWSGQKYFTEGAIQLFNACFTLLPIIMLGIYDMDLLPSTVYKFPQTYGPCIRNECFNTRRFWGWIAMAILESVILSVLPMYFQVRTTVHTFLSSPHPNQSKQSIRKNSHFLNRINSNVSNKSTFITFIHYHQNNEQVRAETGSLGFWEAGATCYTAVLIVVNCKVG